MLGKTSDAQLAETSCDLGDRREGLHATAGLPACWPAAEDLSLCLDTAGRWTVADQVERTGFATAPLRLPSLGAAIGPARGADQSQEALSALQGGALDRAQAGWPQTGTGHPGADGDPAGSEPALVARLRDGHALQRPALPSSDPGRRLHPGMPRLGRRHIAHRAARSARARQDH